MSAEYTALLSADAPRFASIAPLFQNWLKFIMSRNWFCSTWVWFGFGFGFC